MDDSNAVAQLIRKLAQDKCDLFTQMNLEATKKQIVFVGDSLIENFPLHELYKGNKVLYNRGIAGNSTYDIIARLENTVIPLQPGKVFLLAGTNDFMPHIQHNDESSIARRIIEICTCLKKSSSDCQVYVLSLLPANFSSEPYIYKNWLIGKTNEKVKHVNDELYNLCAKNDCGYIDLHASLLDEDGQLDITLTLDGTHINVQAYKMILEQLDKYF